MAQCVNHTIQVLAHLALLEYSLGFSRDALDSLQQALTLGQPGGFVRSIVDVGPTLVPLLEQVKAPKVDPGYVSKLLAGFDPTMTASQKTLTEPLTRREKEILHLLARGLINSEIAEELVISPHTVRTHATGIYAKLAVSGRMKAVRKARRLSILR